MKRLLSNLNSLVSVLLALIVVQMVCYIALRNPVRANWSGSAYYTLSDKTLALLENLDRPVEVYVLFQEEHELYHDIDNLLEEYQYHSRQIRTEWIDPVRDPARAENLASKYALTEAQVVVFDIDGKSRKVGQTDLADYAMPKGRKEPIRTAFKGEQAFSSAIQGLVQEEVPVVYFLVGHGERRVNDFDPASGYSRIGTQLVRDNLELKELMLGGKQRVPADAAALVIAGPAKKLAAVEVEMIEEYLKRSGRVLVMLDALKETGLEPMLRRWGVGLRNDFVVDPENTLRGSDVHVRRYTDHPIAVKMQSITQFILPRSIEPLTGDAPANPAEDRPVAEALAMTSEKSWSETQVEDSSAQFNENTADRRGPFPLAVAVERGAPQELLDVQIRPSRMVVYGDSDFVSNGNMVGGNEDLFMSSVNWLLDREELMAIAPKPIEEIKLSLTRKQLRGLFWISVAGIPSVAGVLGACVWMRRRK